MYEITRASDISILHLYGELSLLEMELLEKTIRSLKRHQQCKILLDLTGVDHLHFEVARKLVREANQLRLQNGELKIAGINQQVRHIFQFTGADQFLEDYSSISDAILSFLKETRQNAGFEELQGSVAVEKTPNQRWANREEMI